MNFLINKIQLLAFVLVILSISKLCAQEGKITITQDSKFEKLLNEKRKIFASNVSNDNFKIQIFNGSTDDARKFLSNFRREFPSIESTVIFNTPNYKVVAGNFKTRISAEYNLLEIKKIYKNALLIRPK